MDEITWLAERFDEHRTHLRAVAYRMLGSVSEAEDAVQDTWLRLSRADAGSIENLGRLADDGHGPGLPEQAAVAPVTAARSRWTCTFPTRS